MKAIEKVGLVTETERDKIKEGLENVSKILK